MKAQLPSDIRYIGVDDTKTDLFESQYALPAGMCYNSYLICDEKTAILDTVDPCMESEWLTLLEKGLAGRTPDYLIVHHMEPDHSGCIAAVMDRYPGMTLVASAKALQFLPQFLDRDFAGRTQAVKDGDTLELGRHSLRFLSAPMVHWPEVMTSYETLTHTFFSADGFGKFGTLDADADDWACEARRYYFNICGKYGAQVAALLQKASAFPIDTICPLHGPILQGELLKEALRLYSIWSAYGVETRGVLVAYASIHGGTKEAAEKLAELLQQRNAGKVAVTDLSRDDQAEAIEDAFRMDSMVIAAPTYDGHLFPAMYDFLHHLELKGYQRRRVGIIENGTWAPQSGRIMREMVSSLKNIEIVEPMVTLKSRLKATDLPALEALADAMAQR
ncbi:MAG: FprA family A-type flavoprotein [Paludibacteraceae bacterium]|nr:FprA family A-type flavoprotein [Paludibacteraceae bacterium]